MVRGPSDVSTTSAELGWAIPENDKGTARSVRKINFIMKGICIANVVTFLANSFQIFSDMQGEKDSSRLSLSFNQC
jgi:hypothetical protein